MLPSRSNPHIFTSLLLATVSGCHLFHHDKYHPPHITARPASISNQCSPSGIPFYLPKPLLVISKNFYHVEEAKVGLTGTATIPESFDEQETYANVTLSGSFSRTGTSQMSGGGETTDTSAPQAVTHEPTLHSPNGAPTAPGPTAIPGDGLAPHTFYTYEIVFVPDLSQKYVLEVNGGPGEIRAAMNLVNGWQFTGLGPYYMKDSSTAQNIMAKGVALNLGLGGAADVVNSVANLKSLAPAGGGQMSASELASALAAVEQARKSNEVLKVERETLVNYAEIHVYEAVLEGDQMVWKPVADHSFNRDYLGIIGVKSEGDAGGAVSGASEEMPVPSLDSPVGMLQQGLKHQVLQASGLQASVEVVETVGAETTTTRLSGLDDPPGSLQQPNVIRDDLQAQPLSAAPAPVRLITDEAVAAAINGTLAPACQPRKRSVIDCLCPRKSQQTNTAVSGVVSN
jgi:hypothetical protein